MLKFFIFMIFVKLYLSKRKPKNPQVTHSVQLFATQANLFDTDL